MKISTIDYRYIEEILDRATNKKLVLWGAGWHVRNFIKNYCGVAKILPTPFCICETTRDIGEQYIDGIPVLPLSVVQEMSPEDTVIIITAGLLDLQAQVVSKELYYFPLYHRRSFEAYAYINSYPEICDCAIGLLADEHSQFVYRRRIENLVNGVFWDQSIYESNPYFNNDLIPVIPNEGAFVFAGAFNGKHLKRARRNNQTASLIAFEPSRLWHRRLTEHFREDSLISLYNNLLWDNRSTLPFEEDTSSGGLGAHVSTDPSRHSYLVETVTIDEIVANQKISLIALDVEGSEQPAIQGAVHTIERDHPMLCLCLYHTLDDYFQIPIQINNLFPQGKYKLHVKQHSIISVIETVLYAI